MRVLCVGDSLGLPRKGCPYERTWFYRLKDTFPEFEFIDFFERRLHVYKALYNYKNYYIFYPSDVIIVQLGICDCAPRFIKEEKLSVLVIQSICRKLGLLHLFWKIVKIRGRNPSCVDTPIDLFAVRFDELISKFIDNGAKKIILIKIGHVAESVVKRSVHFNENVEKYNIEIERLKAKNPEMIVIVDPLGTVDESFFVDGYHCNAKGMDVVFNCLKAEFEKNSISYV